MNGIERTYENCSGNKNWRTWRVTKREASRRRLCLICGAPGANLLKLGDGRLVRACDECLRSPSGESWLNGSTERLPTLMEAEYSCDYRGALDECHSLYCPVHGIPRPELEVVLEVTSKTVPTGTP